VALALDGRPVPRGKVGCHRCGNPPCVNPAHLYVGTQRENMADAVAAGTIARGPRHGQFKHGRYAK
jgi:hypothetical protein